jgi:hypothetical protein
MQPQSSGDGLSSRIHCVPMPRAAVRCSMTISIACWEDQIKRKIGLMQKTCSWHGKAASFRRHRLARILGANCVETQRYDREAIWNKMLKFSLFSTEHRDSGFYPRTRALFLWLSSQLFFIDRFMAKRVWKSRYSSNISACTNTVLALCYMPSKNAFCSTLKNTPAPCQPILTHFLTAIYISNPSFPYRTVHDRKGLGLPPLSTWTSKESALNLIDSFSLFFSFISSSFRTQDKHRSGSAR